MINTTFPPRPDETVEIIDDSLHQLSVYELAIWCFLYTVIAFLAVFGNILVIYITLKPLYNGSVTNLLIVNLAIADIITGILAIPFKFHAALFQRWFWPDVFCKVVPFIETLSLSVSVFTLCTSALSELSQLYFINIDAMNLHSARKLIFIIWLLAFIVSLPYGMFHQVVTFSLSPDLNDNIRQCIPRYGDENWWKAYNIYLTIIHYFVPLIIVDSAYIIIAINVYRDTQREKNLNLFMKKISHSSNNTVTSIKNNCKDNEIESKNQDIKTFSNFQQSVSFPHTSQQSVVLINNINHDNTSKSRRKIITMLILVVTFFTLCWLPLETYLLLNEVQPQINDWHYINILFFCCHWLAMSNSCFNPIIYGLYNEKYKKEYRKLFSKFFGMLCKNSHNNHENFHNSEKKFSLPSTIVVKNMTNKSTVVISNYSIQSECENGYKSKENFQNIPEFDKNLPISQNNLQSPSNIFKNDKKLFVQIDDSFNYLTLRTSAITNEYDESFELDQTSFRKKKETDNKDYIL
ncbi:Probable G-protein coupled receptor 83 [Strongyloides ratti]|uniref:Probable G-protein coupled receptor 83 n=1 Tax=Strongyloides ratti TaxID=34506 RepID=A0A090LMN0_STRRB|nr:Probable G-protein coupled receptor 83 [Strongyloides ratti]CEF70996.1 Probable G-protein coupled receptor 83 [Strongyloides ratti]